jgi:exonuclease SbcD
MKIAHLSDLHFSPKHLKWADRAMAHAVRTAIDERCDACVISGDSFDHAIGVHEPAFTAYLRHCVTIAEHMPLFDLQGTHSHDRPGMLDPLKHLPTKHPIIVMDDTWQYERVIGANGHVVSVVGLPSLNKAEPEVQSLGANAWVRQVLGEIGRTVARNSEPTILVTHGTVTGCRTESGYAMISPDHEFSVEALASAECDAVLLGHIHAHQAWPGVLTPSGKRTTIAYPGSLARLVHGHREPVGFLIWSVEPGNASFEFHESPSRQLLEIEFDGPPNMDEMYALAAEAQPDDAVRVRWSVDEEHAAGIDKQAIRDLFADCDSIQLEPRVLPVQRVRAEGIGRATTLEAKLAHWAETTDSSDALERLQDRLALLRQHDPERIADDIINPPLPDQQQDQEKAA